MLIPSRNGFLSSTSSSKLVRRPAKGAINSQLQASQSWGPCLFTAQLANVHAGAMHGCACAKLAWAQIAVKNHSYNVLICSLLQYPKGRHG